MDSINLPPFYVGQKIFRIRKPISMAKVGQIFICMGCFKCGGCGEWKVLLKEIPSKNYDPINRCECGHDNKLYEYCNGNAKYFAPVEKDFQSITLEKVLETETPLISVN